MLIMKRISEKIEENSEEDNSEHETKVLLKSILGYVLYFLKENLDQVDHSLAMCLWMFEKYSNTCWAFKWRNNNIQ